MRRSVGLRQGIARPCIKALLCASCCQSSLQAEERVLNSMPRASAPHAAAGAHRCIVDRAAQALGLPALPPVGLRRMPLLPVPPVPVMTAPLIPAAPPRVPNVAALLLPGAARRRGALPGGGAGPLPAAQAGAERRAAGVAVAAVALLLGMAAPAEDRRAAAVLGPRLRAGREAGVRVARRQLVAAGARLCACTRP